MRIYLCIRIQIHIYIYIYISIYIYIYINFKAVTQRQRLEYKKLSELFQFSIPVATGEKIAVVKYVNVDVDVGVCVYVYVYVYVYVSVCVHSYAAIQNDIFAMQIPLEDFAPLTTKNMLVRHAKSSPLWVVL